MYSPFWPNLTLPRNICLKNKMAAVTMVTVTMELILKTFSANLNIIYQYIKYEVYTCNNKEKFKFTELSP